MDNFLHAHVFAATTRNADPVSETLSVQVDEKNPMAAALALAAWLHELADIVEQGVQE